MSFSMLLTSAMRALSRELKSDSSLSCAMWLSFEVIPMKLPLYRAIGYQKRSMGAFLF
jgi:hypothetical protein